MEKIEFQGALGDVLAARLDIPQTPPKAFALFAHCFTCSKDILAATRIAAQLNDLGIAVLRFDFTGLGASGGEFANTNFSSNVQDLVKAADYLRDHHAAPAILIGHSLGGAAVLAAAGAIPEIKAVVTIGAPASAEHVSHHFQAAIAEIREKGEAEVRLVGRPFKIKKQFLDDIESQALEQKIAALKKPLLVLHAPLDATVGIENAEAIFRAAKHPKSFVSLDNADHLLTRKEDAEYAATVIAAWASRYAGYDLGDAADQTRKSAQKITGVRVKTTGNGKFQNEVQAGRHMMIADEPADVGGMDSGPNPYDFLLAALGTCTSMTMQMYADHKGLALEGIEVELHHEKIHASDCADCETKEGMLDEITRAITILGPKLTEEQRAKLIEIANKCPVHKTLHGEVRIQTHAVKPS